MALSERRIAQMWVNQGGDPKYARMMAKIAKRESGGRPGINNAGLNSNGTVDHGLFQVNDIWARKFPKLWARRYDPQANTRMAIQILKIQGPEAWATFNPEIDRKFIGADAPKGSGPKRSGKRGGGSRTVLEQTPGVDNSQQRKQLLAQYLLSDQQYRDGGLLELKAGLDAAADVPGQIRERTIPGQARGGGSGGGGGQPGKRFQSSDLAEMFHDPGLNFDNGQPTGAIGGHKHVHVASRNPEAMLWAGRLAQRMGLRVGENPKWDKVDPVHTSGSFHYQKFPGRNLGMAIDVSGDPATLRKFNRRVARKFGVR